VLLNVGYSVTLLVVQVHVVQSPEVRVVQVVGVQVEAVLLELPDP
jgi:hypothetical protein